MNKQDMIKALIERETSPFEETDKPALELLAEAKLEALVAASELEPEQPEPQPDVTALQARLEKAESDLKAATAKKTDEEWVKDAPPAVKKLLASAEKVESDRKTAAIKALSDAKQKAFSEEELKAMDSEQLEKLVALSGQVVDHTPNAPGGSRLGEENQDAPSAPRRMSEYLVKKA